MNWRKITLSNDQVQMGAIWNVQNTFVERYLAHNLPKGVVLLENYNANVFDPVMTHEYYFSPDAIPLFEDLIRQYSNEPCDEPDPAHTKFYLGDEAWLNAL